MIAIRQYVLAGDLGAYQAVIMILDPEQQPALNLSRHRLGGNVTCSRLMLVLGTSSGHIGHLMLDRSLEKTAKTSRCGAGVARLCHVVTAKVMSF